MKPPRIRRSHQPVPRISRTQTSDVFQSSWTSWSSKIIAEGTVESSQRIVGSPHDSRYRRVYSSKSATVSPGGTSGSRRERMNSFTLRRDLVGVDLVAEQQQRVRPRRRPRPGDHALRDRHQRVDLAALRVLVLAQRVRRLVRRGHAAGAEQDPRRPRLRRR